MSNLTQCTMEDNSSFLLLDYLDFKKYKVLKCNPLIILGFFNLQMIPDWFKDRTSKLSFLIIKTSNENELSSFIVNYHNTEATVSNVASYLAIHIALHIFHIQPSSLLSLLFSHTTVSFYFLFSLIWLLSLIITQQGA